MKKNIFEIKKNTNKKLATKNVCLRIKDGPQKDKVIFIENKILTIGRSKECDVVFNDEYTSTNHAKIYLDSNKWYLQDLSSTNGTYFKGSKIFKPVKLKYNDTFIIGKTSCELIES